MNYVSIFSSSPVGQTNVSPPQVRFTCSFFPEMIYVQELFPFIVMLDFWNCRQNSTTQEGAVKYYSYCGRDFGERVLDL